ncbi:hypothetical protein DICVIV_10316 [Dictyocaulus viviparus]|uniref:Uncharacterized protein n=1 Tax=Dictyocaulus viviparus TaxID=29172 RepID=A0A0D8XIW1_DICVI|nr:hypothetical protein DICVIV_10316 [Dictyocaulus viviparus]
MRYIFANGFQRLRTENRLLRQRIDYLEAESSALADRLVKGQVNLAQEAENSINIAHELNKLRDINSDAHRKLEQAYDTIRELSCSRHGDMMDAAVQVDDTSMIEHIHSLQQELIECHTRQADHENTIRDCKIRILVILRIFQGCSMLHIINSTVFMRKKSSQNCFLVVCPDS